MKEAASSSRHDRVEQALGRLWAPQAPAADPPHRDWCCCAIPPTLTALAGWREDPAKAGGRLPVNECPRCGRNDAGGWGWTRTEPLPHLAMVAISARQRRRRPSERATATLRRLSAETRRQAVELSVITGGTQAAAQKVERISSALYAAAQVLSALADQMEQIL